MPELPEVEAARRAIEEHCLGKKIVKSIIADDSKVVDGVSHKDFEASLNGKTIVAAHRKGKNMWLQLNSPPFPSFQFGMTGAIYIKGVAVTKYKRSSVKDTDEWPSKYSKFFVELNDGLEVSFTDKRRFARVRLLDNPVAVPPISELGPDALLEPMAVDEFHKLLSKKNLGIKALLLDQGFISGIGNWVADEVLYQAKIHPLQSASSMSIEVCGTLLNCINEVTIQCHKFFFFLIFFFSILIGCFIENSLFMSCYGDYTSRLYNLLYKLMLTAVLSLVNGCFIIGGGKSLEKLRGRKLSLSMLVAGRQLTCQNFKNSGEHKLQKKQVNHRKAQLKTPKILKKVLVVMIMMMMNQKGRKMQKLENPK
ncbi:formamidopyrimidine-DNA glycosylase-like isoform X5 [Coffea arabica]|uniref:Formamidopyrimidine-DNA glycosylase-like isoform X5 n=1 Tax=Coffea arabica TaxID=13443 RepID=A0ABM4WD21_COFAR